MSSKAVILFGSAIILFGGAALIRSSTDSPAPIQAITLSEGLGRQSNSQVSAENTPPPAVTHEDIWKKRIRQARRELNASASASTTPAATTGSSEPSGSLSEGGASATPTPMRFVDRMQTPSPSATATASAESSASPTPQPSASALDLKTLHTQSIVVDTHVETPLLLTEKQAKLGNIPKGQVDIAKLKQGGVDVVFFSVFVNPWRYRKIAKSQADFIIKTIKQQVTAHDKDIELAYSYVDIQRIVGSGKIAALMGMEGGEPLGSDIKNVDYFYKQGVRYLSPTWSANTLLADSSSQRAYWKGLSKFGKEVVQRMNKLGMLVDVSHISDAAFYDVLKTSNQPVIASHSGVRSVRMHARNLTNDMLKLLAQKGGTVGIYFYPPYIDVRRTSTLAKVVDHIDAAVKQVGAAHVGLGSDFDGLDSAPPVGLENAAKFPAITAELRKRKYSDADIGLILGGSFMRVFELVLK
jgi:membrane dipeptidase